MKFELPPTILYRYYGNIEHVIQLVDKKELYFSSPNNYNDPYDFFPSIQGLDKHAKFLCAKQGMLANKVGRNIKALSHQKKLELITNFRSNFKVCCFTENFNSFRMWSYYANGFKGCCVGFNTPKMLLPSNALTPILPVKYVGMRPKFSDMRGGNPDDRLRILATCKNNEYKDEKEWRCIKYLNHENKELSSLKDGIIKISPDIIEEIILGSQTSENDIDRIKKITKKDKIQISQIKTYSSNEIFALHKQKFK